MSESNIPNDDGSSNPNKYSNEPTNMIDEQPKSSDPEDNIEGQNSGSEEEKNNLKDTCDGNKEDVAKDSADWKGASIYMERAMSQFRHCGLEELLQTYLGELAEKIRQSTLRLTNDPTTRRYIPFLLSPLVDLGVYNIVFPDRGVPYFFIRPNSQNSEPDSVPTETKDYEDLAEIGTASHLPPNADCLGRLVIPRDFSETSYIHMQGGFPLDFPPGTDIRIDPSADITPPTELQKKLPLLSDLLDLNKLPTIELNDPILTAMITTPPLNREDCARLSIHLAIEKETSLMRARQLVLQEAFNLVREKHPSLAQAWALEEHKVNQAPVQPGQARFTRFVNDARREILDEVFEWLNENHPRLYWGWKQTNAFSGYLDLRMTSWVDHCSQQIPSAPVEVIVYNLHTTETTTPPPDESPDLSSGEEQDESVPQVGSGAPVGGFQQQQPESAGPSDDNQDQQEPPVGPMHVSLEEQGQDGPMEDSQGEEDSSEPLSANETVANHTDHMDVDLPLDNPGGLNDRSLKAQIEYMGQLPPASVNILVEPNIWFKERITAAILHEPGSEGTGQPVENSKPISELMENGPPIDETINQPSTSGTTSVQTSTTEVTAAETPAPHTTAQPPLTRPVDLPIQGPSTRVILHPITIACLNSPPVTTTSPVEHPVVEVIHSPSCPAARQVIKGSCATTSENPGCSCAMPPPSGPFSPTKRKRLGPTTTNSSQGNSGSSTENSPVDNPPSPTKKFRRQSPRLRKLRENSESSSDSSPSNDPCTPLKQMLPSTSRGSQSQVTPVTPNRMDVEVSQRSPIPPAGRRSRSRKRKSVDANPNSEAGPSKEKQQASHASPEVRQALQETILERRSNSGSTMNPEQQRSTDSEAQEAPAETVIDLTENSEEHFRQRQESERSEGAEVVPSVLLQILNAPPRPRVQSQERSTPDRNPDSAPEE